jgi:hypothetical protein
MPQAHSPHATLIAIGLRLLLDEKDKRKQAYGQSYFQTFANHVRVTRCFTSSSRADVPTLSDG